MLFSFKSSLLVVTLLASSLSQAAPTVQNATFGTLYTLDNNPDYAVIIAMSISENGTIFGPRVSTKTGGKGLSGLTETGQPNVGTTFGSHAIVSEDNVPNHFPPVPHSTLEAERLTNVSSEQQYLFAVNPGSNTVSMFTINPNNPLYPTLVGKPADTLGEFPMSLAYSASLATGSYLPCASPSASISADAYYSQCAFSTEGKLRESPASRLIVLLA